MSERRNVIGLKAPALETVRIGIVGIGVRGRQALERLAVVPGARITAVCDINPSRLEGLPGEAFTDWKALCRCPDVDLVYICTDWRSHTPIALEAMDRGKHVAVEVPAACTLEEIWALVHKAEDTRRHCMMLENAVYDRFEQVTLAMAKAGVFGEIVHADIIFYRSEQKGWRDS